MRLSTTIWIVWVMLAAGRAGAQVAPSPAPSDLDKISGAVPLPWAARPGAKPATEIDKAIQARDWPRAERLLAAEIERKPNSPDLLKQIAGIFLMDRRPLNAAIALKKAEALAPLDRESRFRLVLAYVALNRGDWARPELDRLVAEDSSNPLYAYWLGRLDYDDGKYEAAVRRLKEVVAHDPGFSRAFDNLGLCYEALNQPEEAIAQYREAIRINREAAEKTPWPPLNLGILLRTRGELTEAEALFREALGFDPRFARAHYQLGTLLEQTGRVEAAVTELREAADADPAYAAPHYALARIYRQQGRRAEADAALAAFQKLNVPAPGERR